MAHLRRRAEPRGGNGRELGHEVLSVVLREGRCRGQYLAARASLESTERATRVEAASATVVVSAGPGSLLIAGAAGFETDRGGAYLVAALTTGSLFAGEGALTRALALELRFGSLVRERAAFSLAVGLTARELPPAEGTGRG